MVIDGKTAKRGGPPKSDFDPKKAIKELEEKIAKDAERFEQVQRFLTIEGEKFKTLVFEDPKTGSVVIRVKTALPFEVRERIQAIWSKVTKLREEIEAAKAKDQPIPLVDDEEVRGWSQQMYQNLADICLDDPWTSWETWFFVDYKTGKAPQILQMMYGLIEEADKEVSSFRKERSGTVPPLSL